MIKKHYNRSHFSRTEVRTGHDVGFACAQDLRDTLDAHRDGCVGMAANMIGVAKRMYDKASGRKRGRSL